MAGLSTHVLDTVSGKPAAGVVIELYELHSNGGWCCMDAGSRASLRRVGR